MKITSKSPENTMEVGQTLGRGLGPGDVVLLRGNLGAGKTHFAKGVALGLDVQDHVTSPTFTIVNEYEGRIALFHIDAYRLEDEEEAVDAGLEEYIYGFGITLIEWPDRIKSLLPDEFLAVEIMFIGQAPDNRTLNVTAKGMRYEKLLEELKTCVYSGD